jgi:methylenetetrahydrofolate dehydrogenase (NADP+)/methenyltetrahydrofolate cyclohydrolase
VSAILIDGKAMAAEIRAEVGAEVAAMVGAGGPAPHLAVVLCGDDPASHTYVRNKGRAAEKAGIRFTLHTPPGTSTTAQLVELVRSVVADDDVDGVLVQLPLPHQIDQESVTSCVPVVKDADGFDALTFGRLAQGAPITVGPGTPMGCMEMLRRSGITIAGARAVVVGRSVIVGRPMALLLTNADATVTICHSRTRDLAAVCREADILVAAIGRPRMITADFVKPGAAVIDVGINQEGSGIVGDVDREAVEPVAGWLTPVPGGVGPMTIAMLLRNTLTLARARRSPVGV